MLDLLLEKWELIKEKVKDDCDCLDVSYNTWIKPLTVHSIKDDTIIILIPSDQELIKKYIISNFLPFFKVRIAEVLGHEYEITFVLESEVPMEEDKKKVSGVTSSPNYENSNLNPKYTFDTFVVGSNNKFAHSASLAVAESPGKVFNPLYIYGGPGLGKTHLMHSIGHFILEHNPSMKILYVTSEEFTNDVIESIRSGNPASMSKLREKYRTVDVLMVDDVQFIIGKDATQEEFFHTFNGLHSAGKAIILSSDKPPREIQTLEERFRSRFEWGLATDIQPPDYETRMAILRKKKEEIYDKVIDEEIIQYIATNITSNIRKLEGALTKIIAFANLNNGEISLALAEQALIDVISPNQPKEITPELIIETVSNYYGIKSEDIISKRRNSEFVIPRQVCMYLCREMTTCSLSKIGKILEKDHSTVMHGIEKIEKGVVDNPEISNAVQIITRKINPQSST